MDALDRLESATGPWGQLGRTWDAAGNRFHQTGSQATTFVYDTAKQRLTSSLGAVPESFTYDNVGQLTQDSRGLYNYSPLGQLTSVTGPTVSATYTYDGAGTRLVRTVNGQTAYTVRSADGQTLSEFAAPCAAPVSARDLIYGAGRVLGAVRTTAAKPVVAVTGETATVDESAGSVSVDVVLTTPGGAATACPATVAYETAPGTATAGADYVAAGGDGHLPGGQCVRRGRLVHHSSPA